MAEIDSIQIVGARQHNLKNIDLAIPKGKLVVFTGPSGLANQHSPLIRFMLKASVAMLNRFRAMPANFGSIAPT